MGLISRVSSRTYRAMVVRNYELVKMEKDAEKASKGKDSAKPDVVAKKYSNCQKYACDIQWCLKKWDNNFSKCRSTMDELVTCCIATSEKGINEQIPCSGYKHKVMKAYQDSLKQDKK